MNAIERIGIEDGAFDEDGVDPVEVAREAVDRSSKATTSCTSGCALSARHICSDESGSAGDDHLHSPGTLASPATPHRRDRDRSSAGDRPADRSAPTGCRAGRRDGDERLSAGGSRRVRPFLSLCGLPPVVPVIL
jgi:hypothetical protein